MAKVSIPVAGRAVAVTGGARGIGRATAEVLLAAGARVAIGDLDAELSRKTADELGRGCVGLPLDVTDRGSFAAFVADAEAAIGPLDVLVNNAGIMPIGPFLAEPDDSARRMFDINVHGVLTGMKIALPAMLERGRGHIVNIASTAGLTGFPGGASYCGTKAAVVIATEAVRAEHRGSGVEFSVVMPGIVKTELATGLTESRAVKPVTPQQVAEAILEALRTPRFEVFVPRAIGRIRAVFQVLPRPAREAMGRALKADKVLATADLQARRSYELRAARSEPALPPAEAPAAIEAAAPADD